MENVCKNLSLCKLSEQFPELILALAEQNWVNGYTQALNDTATFKTEKEKNEQEKNNKKKNGQE